MSRVLIDTQSLIWFAEDATALSRRAVALVDAPTTIRVASAASLWEMAIKVALGKLTLKAGSLADFTRRMRLVDIEVPPVVADDAVAVASRCHPAARTRTRSTG